MSIVVIGTVALDSIETPFGKADEILGGSGTHFAASASFFSKVALSGVVGEDFPESSLNFLKKRGGDLVCVKRCPGKTFRWAGRYGYDMSSRETLKTELGVIADFAPEFPGNAKSPEHLFLGNTHPKLQLSMLDQAGRPGKISLDTMNLWIKGDKPELEQVIKRVDLMVINEEEARQLTGELALLKAARKIHAAGPQTVIIKRGEAGALLFYKGEVFSAPGLPLEEVKDPTGAGDSFAGGLIGYLDREGRYDLETLKKAVIVGSAMASFNVEDFGCRRLEKLSPDEVRGRVEEFRRLADFGRIQI